MVEGFKFSVGSDPLDRVIAIRAISGTFEARLNSPNMAGTVDTRFAPDYLHSEQQFEVQHLKPVAILLVLVLGFVASSCARRSDSPPSIPDGAEEDAIHFERNSEFTGPRLRVFVTLEDGSEVSVNTAEDAVDTRPGTTPIPGHQAQDWTFVKDTDDGTSVVYALVSWDSSARTTI